VGGHDLPAAAPRARRITLAMKSRPLRSLRVALAAMFLSALAAGPASADSSQVKRDWPQEKCFRYGRDWSEALRRFGRDGLSADFVAANAAFIGSGCLNPEKICPRSAKDRRLADVLAIRVVNEGMSTTFLPFDCPR
jgi:hypothetical protein